MNEKVNILDCTLRDGGYINDWNFGLDAIRDIVRKLIEAEVDYIEIGFLRNCEYSPDRTLFNNTEELKRILPSNKGRSRLVVMALHNLYDINQLEDNDGTLDLIRITFHDYDINEGLSFVSKVMTKGYQVSCNPINIMGYSDKDLINLIEKVNMIHPAVFSIVDTFGSMMMNDLLRIYSVVEHNLDKSIKIGLHLHENLGLAFSLAQTFLNMKSADRQCIIDGSLYGMGRVPGNLSIELLMDYLNKFEGMHYHVDSVYDAINDYIEIIKAREPWGYSMAYALSAKYNLHRNYSEYLLGKGKLRAKDINYVLASVEESKKATFDQEYIESLYEKYQNVSVNDVEDRERIKSLITDRDILLLAPGRSLKSHEVIIRNYIRDNNPVIISVNFADLMYDASLSFFTNLRRYSQYRDQIISKQLIISSNLSIETKDVFAVVDYYRLSCDETGLFDNSMIMLLRLLSEIGLSNVAVAGFDGFTPNGDNYLKGYKGNAKSNLASENTAISSFVKKLQQVMNIRFITPSKYQI